MDKINGYIYIDVDERCVHSSFPFHDKQQKQNTYTKKKKSKHKNTHTDKTKMDRFFFFSSTHLGSNSVISSLYFHNEAERNERTPNCSSDICKGTIDTFN